jgi:hypothetical protein
MFINAISKKFIQEKNAPVYANALGVEISYIHGIERKLHFLRVPYNIESH